MSPVLPVTGHLLLLAWHQHNSGIRQPSLSPPFSNKCWIHPWTKARLWELWDSAPHTKRPRRGLKPLPSMHQLLGRQSLGAVWSRQAPATFRSPSQPQQGNTKRVLPGEDTHGWKGLCRNPAFEAESPACHQRIKKMNCCIDDGRRNLARGPSPEVAKLGDDVSPRETGRSERAPSYRSSGGRRWRKPVSPLRLPECEGRASLVGRRRRSGKR